MRRVEKAIVVCMFLSSVLIAQEKDWKKALTTQLREVYPLRKVGYVGWHKENKEQGATLVVQQLGILGICQSALVIPYSRVRNGVISNPASRTKAGEMIFKPGIPVYVRGVDVDDTQIRIRVTTTEAFATGGLDMNSALFGDQPDTSRECNASVLFEFEKGFLPTASVDAVKAEIAKVLSTAAEMNAPKTIELGQTIEQVEKILGKPINIAKLGAKTIYTYKNMKVIFTDGKVTDVQ